MGGHKYVIELFQLCEHFNNEPAEFYTAFL